MDDRMLMFVIVIAFALLAYPIFVIFWLKMIAIELHNIAYFLSKLADKSGE